MTKKRIGIDLDSTLNRLDHAWSAWIAHHHDHEFSIEKWKSWDLHTHTTAGPKIYDFLKIPGMFNCLDVHDGAVSVVNDLVIHNEVYIVTHTIAEPGSFHVFADKAEWLHRNFPMVPTENICFMRPKWLMDLDLLIDDGPHNFKGFKGQGLLIDAPWNQSVGTTYPRVKNWGGVQAWCEGNGYLPK